ncbi:unnamed protein product [Pleuronectes platessa]|uniref:Uncharacterized protein n=1 Tax=Pleuronectes platessa TaxID=8262 RepID=A0A9N7VH38_PLEPL|nr:unnamed protein product [Pleuronectes platessa]
MNHTHAKCEVLACYKYLRVARQFQHPWHGNLSPSSGPMLGHLSPVWEGCSQRALPEGWSDQVGTLVQSMFHCLLLDSHCSFSTCCFGSFLPSSLHSFLPFVFLVPHQSLSPASSSSSQYAVNIHLAFSLRSHM